MKQRLKGFLALAIKHYLLIGNRISVIANDRNNGIFACPIVVINRKQLH